MPVIMRSRVTFPIAFTVIMTMFLAKTMDVPHSLNRHENGAIPGCASRLQLPDGLVGDLGMGAAAGFGGAMHRLDLGTNGEVDGSAQKRFAFQSKHPALGKAGRGVTDKARRRADNGVAGKRIPKSDRSRPCDTRIGGKPGEDGAIHERQGRRLQEDG